MSDSGGGWVNSFFFVLRVSLRSRHPGFSKKMMAFAEDPTRAELPGVREHCGTWRMIFPPITFS